MAAPVDDTDDEAWVETEGESQTGMSSSGRGSSLGEEEDLVLLEPPNGLLSYVSSLMANPWFILAAVVASYYLWQRLQLREHYLRWSRKRDEDQRVAHIKKNPDLYRQRMEAMEAARRRQQAQNEAASMIHEEQRKAREEEKRAKRLEELENLTLGRGYRNKSDLRPNSTDQQDLDSANKAKNRSAPSESNSLRPAYNPLMGSGGGGGGYRPSPRSGGSSGG